MNPIAEELNQRLDSGNPHLTEMMSRIGRQLFFPKGILVQSAEAKEKAHRFNATAGIAMEQGETMRLDSVMRMINDLRPDEALTYAPSFGLPDLRRLWQGQLFDKNPSLAGRPISLPVVSCGITHGISVFADLWVDPGDVVLLPEPMWGNYNMIFQVRKDAAVAHYPMFAEDGGFHLQAFAQRVDTEARQRGKLIVMLNFPHNPSGYTINRREGEAIARTLIEAAEAGSRVIAVTDDSYFGLFYEPDTLKESLFSLLCGQHPRLLAVKLDGCTKENFVWGLRVGFMTYGAHLDGDPGPVYDALERKTAGCVRGTISNASHLSQSIVLKSMQSETFAAEKAAKFEILKRRALRVKTVLADPKFGDAWEAYPFNSGYFMCLKLKTVAAEKLRRHLLDTYGVGLIAIGDKNLRVAFSCIEEQDLAELFDVILQGVTDLSASKE
ncbi:MAG: aminotransferase class I/II-fold pyridoxal phosphate-dependent enzyme [Desulfobacterales bacterium]